MTTIERSRFIADMSTRQIPVKDLAPTLSGVPAAEVDALAGGDHVFNTPAEYGALYDKLVALEKADKAKGVSGDLDRASMVYAKFAAPSLPKPSMIDPSARPKTTGIGQVKPQAPSSASQHVRAFGNVNADQLKPAADKNAGGLEAGARKRIMNETDRVEARVRALEEKAKSLPPGAERTKVEQEIDREVTMFENMVASERAGVIKGKGATTATDPGKEITKKLPPYLKDSVEKDGVVIPGMPGAVKPSTSPPGFEWKINF